MRRSLLIAGGTLGGLGAVLAITPPQISPNENSLGGGVDTAPVANNPSAQTTVDPTPTPTNKPVASAEPSAAAAAPSKSAKAQPATESASPEPTQTKALSSRAVSGTFIGDPYTMRYGTVQVQITINGGKITDAQAIQAPSGRDQRYTDMAVPVMRQKTIAAQCANITGVSAASYTSYAWYESLQSALKKAGWM